MKKLSCIFLILATFASSVHAEVSLNGLFADGLVLQCEMPAPVWGTADPGEPVTVEGPFGVSYHPLSDRWSLSGDTEVNYMMTVAKAVARG